MDVLELMQNHIIYALLIFTRISGIFTLAPVFDRKTIPLYIKAGLSLIFTLILFPLLVQTSTPQFQFTVLSFAFSVIGEFLFGLVFGFAASLIFSAVQIAGQLLDTQIGFGIVSVFDPQSQQQVPLIGNFKYLLALLLYLSTNGHHVLLSALFNSFKIIPIMQMNFNPEIVPFIVDLFVGVFIVAFKISLPVLISLFLTDVALGILARTMPQMNIFIVGVPGKIVVGIFVLSLALPVYVFLLEVGFNEMYSNLYHLFLLYK